MLYGRFIEVHTFYKRLMRGLRVVWKFFRSERFCGVCVEAYIGPLCGLWCGMLW